ncbi:GDP-L-fucose synthase [Clostridium aestuarii]|uniref:GDP-L-fucose synthase n=1 Tax=Clostridium aestuarii TaxID=338193 RepID=A0ABT4CWN3_9CLOT|nr:GDP-L-fucose synthase [Clostridium aestuarii]MCY6482752.1 GDP-L-fucose synthase [Clostridium aestuarii]
MEKNNKIYVAGHNGMVGSAIVRKLKKEGYKNIIVRTRQELDLIDQAKVEEFFYEERPEYVILAAAKVGGIEANIKYPTEFLMENLIIQCNVIRSAFNNKVTKLVFLGSSCIYPKNAKQPLKEEYLLSGCLEPTNEGYSIAKIAGLKACEFYNKQYGVNYISIMPCNLYGENDNFDLKSAHVIPALIRRIYEAKMNKIPFVEIWGGGNQYREFMYVDDMADAALFLMENYDESQFINVGTGKDVTIKELAETIKKVVGYEGKLKFDTTKPDGMFRKVLDVSRLDKKGWKYKTELYDGVVKTYNWYLNKIKSTKSYK